MKANSSPIKVGFVGAGMVGQMHLAQYAHIENVSCVALAELRPELRACVGEQYRIPALYTNHYEMLEQADIDAVVVVTRRHNTGKTVFDCLQADKHVFSEKPMAKTFQQGAMLVDQAASVNKRYVIGYQKRHDEAVLLAKQRLQALRQLLEFGALKAIQVWNYTGQDRDYNTAFQMTTEPRGDGIGAWEQTPDWLLDNNAALYDRFINVFCHDINIVHFLMEQEIQVCDVSLHDEQNIKLLFTTAGVPVSMQCGLRELQPWQGRGEWNEGVKFLFDKGSLSIRFPGPLLHGLCAVVSEEKEGRETILHAGNVDMPVFHRQAENFINSIQHTQPNFAQASVCLSDMAIIENIWKQYQQSYN